MAGLTKVGIHADMAVDSQQCKDRAEFFRDLSRRLERSHPYESKCYAEAAWRADEEAAILRRERTFSDVEKEVGHVA